MLDFAATIFFILLCVWIGLEIYKKSPDFFEIDEDRNVRFKNHFRRRWHDDDEDYDDFVERWEDDDRRRRR